MSINSQSIRVATFNVSMEATNYLQQGKLPIGNELSEKLEHGKNLQIKNIYDQVFNSFAFQVDNFWQFEYLENIKKVIRFKVLYI